MLTIFYIYVKVKWSRHRPGVAQTVGRGIALLFHNRGKRRGWVVSSTPRPHFITPGKTRYPLYRSLGGPQGRSGRAENLVPTGIRSRSVQSIVSRYTEWATRPTHYIYRCVCACVHTRAHTHTPGLRLKYRTLLKRMQFTFTAWWVLTLATAVGRKHTDPVKNISLYLCVTFHLSPFVICSVKNKPEVKFRHRSSHKDNYIK